MQQIEFAFTKEENKKNINEITEWYESIKDFKPEEMSAFFTKRLDGYDDHMKAVLDNYDMLPELLPKDTETLIDLGCGTGLELEKIFIAYPDIKVTGIDMSKPMLDALKDKYLKKNLNLICADYFEHDFGQKLYDAAISVQSLHHFKYDKKANVYKKIYDAIKDGGVYIENDYTASSLEYEKLCQDFYDRQREKFNVPDDMFVHIDIPLTIEHTKELLLSCGFKRVEAVFKKDNTVVTVAYK